MLVWYGQDYGKELGIHRGANSKILSQIKIKIINGESEYLLLIAYYFEVRQT